MNIQPMQWCVFVLVLLAKCCTFGCDYCNRQIKKNIKKCIVWPNVMQCQRNCVLQHFMYCGLLMFGFWTSSTRLCTWALKCALKFKTISIVLQMVIIELVWRNMQNMRKRDGKSTVKWPQKTEKNNSRRHKYFLCLFGGFFSRNCDAQSANNV